MPAVLLWLFRRYVARVALSLAGLLSLSFIAEGKVHDLISIDGSTIKAELVEMVGRDSVTIRREDGREFYAVPLDRFSGDTRTAIIDWFKSIEDARLFPDINSDSEIKIGFSRGRDDDLNEDGDPDDRVVTLEPSIVFYSDNFEITYQNVEGTVIVIGESVLTRDEMKVLNRQNFTVTIPPRENVRWEGKPFTNRYDSNARNGSAHGYKYEDYLIILYNREGEPAIITSSRNFYEKIADQIMKASPKKSYNEDFSEEVEESRV
ncbi:MAG: hypothetical protein AAGJ81_11435 [Verrucomicrobiota bacterium]